MELVAEYLRYAKRYYGDSPRSEYATMKRAAELLKRLYARTPAAEFGPPQLKAIRQTLIDADGSRNYINFMVKRVVRIFKWAAGEGKLPAAVPAALAMAPGLRKGRSEARETEKVGPVAPEVVDATLPHLSSVVRDMVEFQRLTGCRPGELCELRPGSIDRSGEVWKAALAEHKTAQHGRSRTIYIGQRTQEILAPYLLCGADDYCFTPADAVQEQLERREAERQTPLSCGNKPGSNRVARRGRPPGKCYTTLSYARAISRACDRAFPAPAGTEGQELKDWQKRHRWSPNRLRKLLATRVRAEFDLDAAKTLLGHSQVGTTEIYAEKDRKRAIEVARQIG